jgi:hypothetical protein
MSLGGLWDVWTLLFGMAFTVDVGSYLRYAKDLKEATKRVRKATSYYLTDLASEGRKQIFEEIHNTMIVRNARFVRGQVQIRPASKTKPTMSQVSRVGSVAKGNFTGWKEQRQAGATKGRVGMTRARGGTRRGRLKGRYRMKPGKRYPTPDNTPTRGIKSAGHRAHAFLRIMSRARKVPFVLYGHWKLPSGLWILEGRHGKGRWPKPKLLQAFGANSRIKRNKWMHNAIKDLIASFNPDVAWAFAWHKAGLPRR